MLTFWLISSRDPLTNQAWVTPQYPVETIHGFPTLKWDPSIHIKVVGKTDST